jgi:alkanesulfonate monooxygenase
MELAGYLASEDFPFTLFVGQRVGLIAPTMCSRMFATLDQLNGGRVVAVLEMTPDVKADGLDPTGLAARTSEYAGIMRQLWGADQPLDHAGEFYRFNKARTAVPPLQKAAMPLFLAASVEDAQRVLAHCACAQPFDGVIVTSGDAKALKGAFKSVLIGTQATDVLKQKSESE